MDMVKLLYEPISKRAARRALLGRTRARLWPEKGRFTRSDVKRLLDAAWRRYDEVLSDLPEQPTRGSTMNVRLACFTFSFFEQLLATGAEREYAIELVADASWQVYQMWARLASAAGRLAHGKSTGLAFAVRKTGDREGLVSLKFPRFRAFRVDAPEARSHQDSRPGSRPLRLSSAPNALKGTENH